jgi:hypothetical protein
MKDIPEFGQNHRNFGIRKLSLGSRVAAWLTGTSVDELARAPDDDLKTVRLAGMTLVLIGALAMLGWWLALGIARGGYTLENLPFAFLAGVIIFVIDRAMLRRLWAHAGRRAAEHRGFHTEAAEGWFGWLVHLGLRLAVSLVVSLTTASFIELEIFKQDTQSYIAEDNREQNRPLFEAVATRVDAAIAEKRAEIVRLDDQADTIIAEARQIDAVAQAAAAAQVEALIAERAGLQQRVAELTRDLACQTQNLVAEDTGQVRCDGVAAVAGTGDRYDFAVEMAEFARAERTAGEARIRQIDDALARLQDREAPAGIPPEARDLLNQIAAQRAQAMADLDRLLDDRDAAVRESAVRDAGFVPLPDGLIVRGEALEALANASTWLQTRILLVFLTLLVLDLGAILVMTVMPAPRMVVLGEVLTAEVVIQQALAQAEQAICQAKQSILDARARTTKTEDEVDQRITSLRRTMKTRKMVSDRIDGDLEAGLDEAV